MNKMVMAAVLGTGVLVAGLAVNHSSFAGAGVQGGTIPLGKQAEVEYPQLAQITLDQAIQAAQASTPGKVMKAGLEDEDGFLVYGVEVVTPEKAIMEVKVDAGSGKVLASSPDKADREEEDDDDEKGENGK